MKYTAPIFYTFATIFLLSPAQAFAHEDAHVASEAIYLETCAACHGEDGKGAFDGMPDFTDPKGRLAKDDATLIQHITEGFQTDGSPMAMPEKGGNEDLTEEDIKGLVAYLRSSFGEKK